MKYMLDSNICIYIIKNKPPAVLEEFQKHINEGVCISSITLAELEFGVSASAYPEKNSIALKQFLSAIDVLPFDSVASACYGVIRAELQRKGNREIIKQNLTKIKNEYIDISREILNISEQRRENYSQTQEIKDKLESIDVYKKRIEQINEDTHDLKTQEKQLGRFDFKRKKQITTEIQKCEQDKNSLLKDFKTKHQTDFYHANQLTAQLKSDLKINNHNENFTDKANTLHKQKEAVKFDYQKIKASADRHYFFNKGEIDKALKNPTSSDTNEYFSNINEQLLIKESERQLNHITAEDTLKIAGQQKKLIPTPALEIKRSLEIER